MGDAALLIGNSDGIGLATTRALLDAGWRVTGLSRSAAPHDGAAHTQIVVDLADPSYPDVLAGVLDEHGPFDACIFCAGIGEGFDVGDMARDLRTFEVNLMGLVRTTALVIPRMVARGRGHFIGLSSLADSLTSPDAPSYHASKAGFTNYLEGVALAVRPTGVHVTNLRFGFVDTKMAKGDVRPFMMSVDRSARHVMRCLDVRPVRYSAPRFIVPLVAGLRWLINLRILAARRWPWSARASVIGPRTPPP